MTEALAGPDNGAPAAAAWADACHRLAGARADMIPALRFQLAETGPGWLSDAAVARVRGFLGDLAEQLAPGQPALMQASLAQDDALLAHLHALALEGVLTERLAESARLDPVLSPLLQELLAAPDPAIARAAMTFLAAQARFFQHQQRMRLPLGELRAELVQAALAAAENLAEPTHLAGLRGQYDEAAGRLSLASRLVHHAGASRALVPAHAGVALFATALAGAARVPRDAAVLLMQPGEGAALASALHAAGVAAASAAAACDQFDPQMPRASVR